MIAPANLTEDSEAAKKEEKKKNKEIEKATAKKQKQFIDATTFDDVIIDKTKPIKVGRGPDDFTYLQSIKAVSPTQLSVYALRHFCTIHGINGYKDQSKVLMCTLIVDRLKLKNLGSDMYPDDFTGNDEGRDNKSDDEQASGPGKVKKLKKGSKPPAVTKDGTYYRVILTYFLQDLCHFVTRLGENPTAKQLDDSKQLLHADKYAKLAEAYSSDHDDLNTFIGNHQIYADAGVTANQPSVFNELSPLEFCQTMDYINSHYRDTKRKCA